MKKKLIAVVLMLALVLTFGLVACGEAGDPYKANKDVYYFGWAHQACLGVAHAKTDETGKLVILELDEIFNLANLTRLTTAAATLLGDNAVITAANGNKYAKYIQFDGEVYQAQMVYAPNVDASGANTALNEPAVPNLTDRVATSANGIRYFKLTGTTLDTKSIDTHFVEDQAFAMKYFLAAKTFKAEVSTKTGTTAKSFVYLQSNKTTKVAITKYVGTTETATLVFVNNATFTSAGFSIFKRESGYGPIAGDGGNYPTGIQGTYAVLEAYVMANGFDYTVPTAEAWNAMAKGSGAGQRGEIFTGATANDTPNYLALLKGAGDLIKK